MKALEQTAFYARGVMRMFGGHCVHASDGANAESATDVITPTKPSRRTEIGAARRRRHACKEKEGERRREKRCRTSRSMPGRTCKKKRRGHALPA